MVGKTLAIMRFGKVGSEVARSGKGLGMNVVTHNPYAPADRARVIGIDLVSFDQAISTADFISLHMPLTPSTKKVFNDNTFTNMKKGVRIINVARGRVIDEDAFGRIVLVKHEKVTVTPHLGASTKEAQEDVAIDIAEAVVGALKGELSATTVNAPMVLPEVVSELNSYIMLAEKLGKLAVQLVSGKSRIKNVKVDISTIESKVGSVVSDNGQMTCLGSFGVDVSLEGNLILSRQVDQPGMIGCVGNILAQHNVNVSFMSVGRNSRKKMAIMAIGVDEEPTQEALDNIGSASTIKELVFLKL
ncbi:hypothetical protein RJT34_31627 [Clitoria ternatea]|uniref:ACT domain-containing protein n=1 Tax=Clitoria ternatea TaxID=43366 RepID=A0AAN9I553_CLITE